jgi:hypothetical protein
VEIGSRPDVPAYLRERVSTCQPDKNLKGMRTVIDLFLLEPEYQYHAARARHELKPVRYRKWRRRLEGHGPSAATNEKNWIN